jgi:hypothetical protein
MTEDEWLRWIEFYKLQPFDDYHRFARPAALVAHSMSGASLDDLLGYLEKRPQPQINSVEQGMLKALGLRPPPKG